MAIGLIGLTALLGGVQRGGAEATLPACPASGKSICVSITDQEKASISPTGSDHYLADSVDISNGGSTANLVNITVTITWKDLGVATTSSEYRPAFSDPRCTEVPNTPRTLSCTAPKNLVAGQHEIYRPLVFRTATDSAATHMELKVTATAKEQDVAKKGKNPPIATIDTTNATPYEGLPDQDVSWAGGDDISVSLATTSAASGQFSKLNIPAGVMPAEDFATLTEADCPAGFTTCIGQKVTVQATGISPINLQIFYTGPLPTGLNAGNLVLVHNGVSITRACSGDFFTEPSDLFAPPPNGGACRRVSIDRSGPGDPHVIIDGWDTSNGDFQWR
jgi:hypothetical protein